MINTCNCVLAASPGVLKTIPNTSEEEEIKKLREEEGDRDDWIWDDDLNNMMP
jgi:hypothetical protein